jgi:replication-associated recombination protein RarA
MPSLCEQYHPKAWSDIVGQDRVVRQVELIRRRNGCLVGRNYWISGLSGTGKSTMADLIAREAADDVCIHELVGREIGVKDIKDLRPELERCRGVWPWRAGLHHQ